ncbi:MAG TPA: anti-sigma factor [Pilimelia sp.]|nr:anti-sigma factor [Pilimelia sp.]
MATDIHALAGAYVLDALDDIERAAFGRHLAECETCAVEVVELRETTARLADLTWATPPPRLREQVLAQVSRTRQVTPGKGGREGQAPTRWRRWTAAAVAAGILTAGAGAVTYAIQEQRVREQREEVVKARAETARIEAVLAAPDARLRAETHPGSGRVTLVVSDSLDSGVAVLAGLPDPGRDKAYQLWKIGEGDPVQAGVLPPGASGGTRLVSGLRDVAEFGVSLEPAGGSPQPTSTPMVMSLT